MDNIIDMGPDIAVGRTPEFFKAAHRLSAHISGLDLSKEDNDKLVALAIDQVQEAERAAFAYGMKMGVELERFGGEEE